MASNGQTVTDFKTEVNGMSSHGLTTVGNETFHNGNAMRRDSKDSSAPSEAPTASTVDSTKPLTKEVDTRYGCCFCFPKILQPLANAKAYLVCICYLVFVQSMITSGYSSAILTTIEQRYNLWTSELGMIISAYDVTSVIAGLFVSYTGQLHRRPMWLARGAFILSVGTFVFAIPHFFSGYYKVDSTDNDQNDAYPLCNKTTTLQCEEDIGLSSDKWAFVTFIIAFGIIGIGASPIYCLGPTYLYDNVKPSQFPVYSSIMYAMGALGPATGFMMGAGLLSLYVHPDNPPSDASSDDSSWIGAWWIGFLICGFLALLVTLPMAMFPKELPGVEESIVDDDEPTFAGYGTQLKDTLTHVKPRRSNHFKKFPRVLWRLLKNPLWLLASLIMVVEQSIGTAFNRFVAKYMEEAFDLPTYQSAILTGSVLIPAAVLGIITGGVLMKKLNLESIGIAKFLLILNFIPTLCIIFVLLLPCNSTEIIGGNTETLNLTSCFRECNCDRTMYGPVCGSDGQSYFSPCHAGCHDTIENDVDKTYFNCGCINAINATFQTASQGKCKKGCEVLPAFLVLLFILVFVTTCGQNPVLLITLRSVDAGSRSFALGMQNLLIQLLAFIPTPVYFGRIFDAACIFRVELCGDEEGACQEYDMKELPFYVFGSCIGLKGVTIILLVCLLVVSKVINKKNQSYDMREETIDPAMSNQQGNYKLNNSIKTISSTVA